MYTENHTLLEAELRELKGYGEQAHHDLSTRKLITFHDGFGYFAEAFGLEILAAVEEESGSEISARDIIAMTGLIRTYSIPAVFTETNGSTSAASVICTETGAAAFTLDMALSGQSYFDAMRSNIDTIQEARQ